MYGFFMENGPYEVTKNQTLLERKNAWSEDAHYLIIDQPAGVGLSYGKKNTYANEAEAMNQLYRALQAFYERYPELASRPLYIAGESYAGKYIPELSMRILVGNQANKNINLQGIIIGDGWVNPRIQQSANAEFAYSHGLIDKTTYKKVTDLYRACAKEIDRKKPSTRKANQVCGKMQALIQKESGGLNLANLYVSHEPSDAPMIKYLNQKDVRQNLHVASGAPLFSTFSQMASDMLEIGEQDSVAPLYAKLLKQNIKVLIYNGLDDAKDSNFMSTDKWLSALVWPSQQAFSSTKTCVWHVNQKVAGYVRTANALTQIKIRHAGHLAPIDQPEVLLAMFRSFIKGQTYC
jgi:carboxypeptidase C (cathepsin A)